MINEGDFCNENKNQIDNIVKEIYRHIDFSGVILVKEKRA